MRFGGPSVRLNTVAVRVFRNAARRPTVAAAGRLFSFPVTMLHTRSCPAALFDLHSVFTALVRSTALPRRPGVTSPACIISGDGYSVVEVLFRICDRLFH